MSAWLSRRWKSRPTLARIVSDSDTISLKFTRSPSTPATTHACVCDCHLRLRHALFLTLEAHLHTFSHAWTHPPLPMWERPVLEDTLRCCKAGRISQVKYLDIRHLLSQVLSWKLLADTTPVVNGPAPADYCVLGAPVVICTAHTCPDADPVCHMGLQLTGETLPSLIISHYCLWSSTLVKKKTRENDIYSQWRELMNVQSHRTSKHVLGSLR